MKREPILECDVLVLGSGAAGLATAVTAATRGLRVMVAEKAGVFGGTSAWSGGWMWIPGNPLATRAGIVEEAEASRTYLRNELGVHFDADKVDALLESGPDDGGVFRAAYVDAFHRRQSHSRFSYDAGCRDRRPFGLRDAHSTAANSGR